MANNIVIPQNNSRIITQAVYDQEGKGLVLADVRKVIFTVRILEDSAAFLIQIIGLVEYEGTGDDDPGIVAAELLPADVSEAATPAQDWFDVTIIFWGHWFDQGDHAGRRFLYLYGKTPEVRSGKNPLWHELEAGSLYLADDSVNFIEATTAGVISSNTTAFTTGRIPLYIAYVESGEIIADWPGTDWFAQGAHSNLEFHYDAGKLLTTAGVLLEPVAGHVDLEDDTTNYIEIHPTTGVVTTNPNGFTAGLLPLYTALTASGDITTVTPSASIDFVQDKRTVWTRGDRIFTSAKDRVQTIYSITKATEILAEG